MSRMRRAGAAALLTVAAVTTAVGAGAPAVGAAAASKDSGTTCTDTYSGGSGGLWTTSAGWSAGPPSSTSAVCITSGTVTVPDDFGTTGYVVYSAASISVSNGAELAIANEDDGSLYLNVGSISNSGTVQLNGGANGGSTLDVSGTMTNSGTFDVPDDVQPGYSTGGPLFLVASSFTNTGALTVESPAGFTIGATGSQESATGGTYTNEGTITTSPSENGGDEWYGSMGFAPGTDLVQQGTITNEVNGTVNVGGEFDVEGGSLCTASPIYASATVHFGSTAAVNPTCAAGQTTDTIGIDPTTNTNTLAGTLSGTVPAQYTVIVGESDSGGGYDVDATGAVNDGTITVWGGYNGQNHLTAEGTFTNNGTLDLPEDYANPTVLEMTTFDNTGTFSVEESNRSPVVFEGPASTSGTLDNTGTVDVAGGYLQLTPQSGASTTLVAQSGLVEVTGSGLLADSGGLTVDGGSFCTSTDQSLTDSATVHFATTAAVNPTCAAGQTTDTIGIDPTTNTNTLAGTLSGTVPAQYTVIVGESDSGGGYDVDATGAVNDGTITVWGGYNGQNHLTAEGTFTNNGTLDLPEDYANPTVLEMTTFDNTGTFSVEESNRSPVVFEGPASTSGTLDNTGTVDVAGGYLQLTPQSGASTTLVAQSGLVEVTGSGLLADSGGLTVDGGSFCTSTPDGLTETGSIAFAASVPAGAVCGTGLTSDTFDVGVDSSTMLTGTVPAAWTLDIGSAGNGGTTTLTVSGAAVNDGTIVLHGGYNGPINLDAPAGFTNNGTFTTPDLYTTVTPVTTPKFTNNGTLDDDGGHLTLSGALVDNGTTEITNVNLSVGGAFTVGKKGVVEALGSTSSGFGVLTVGTGSKLAGTLHLVVPSGEGTAGQQATIVSGTGLTGSFKKLTELVAGTSSTASGEYFSQTASSASDMITATGVATVTAPASVAPKTTDDVSVGGYPVSQGLKLTLTEGAKTVGKGNGSSGATGSATLKLKMATSVPAGTGTLTTLAKKLGLTITVPVAVS